MGCGRGLLLIAAANNATIERVEDRVKLQTGDARTLPFGDETFDVIVSSFAFHNIPDKSERAKAIREVVRDLKPRGQIAIEDVWHTSRVPGIELG